MTGWEKKGLPFMPVGKRCESVKIQSVNSHRNWCIALAVISGARNEKGFGYAVRGINAYSFGF